ncbi:hypothetical protein [Dyadobacter sp.]|uniref:hypothetical protein n=1 Tax=Dyadobacter sp. TaxID=1914288 RepID=UPI003F6E93DC
MKPYVFLLMIIGLLHCKAKNDEQTSATKILNNNSVVSNKQDSSQELKNSLTALPGVDFGISLKDYQATNKYMMQGLGSNTYFVKPFFNDESELFKIELSGISRNASYSDVKLWEDHTNLVKFFERDNGAPKILAANPRLKEFKSGEIKWTHSWSSYSKRIKVGIAEGAAGETYEVVGWIYDKAMLNKQVLADSLMLQPKKKSVYKPKKQLKRQKKVKHRAEG